MARKGGPPPARPAKRKKRGQHQATRLAHAGREPKRYHGFVNPPVFRGSTVLYPSFASLEANDQEFSYGRLGTPTTKALARGHRRARGWPRHGADAVGPLGHRRDADGAPFRRRSRPRLRQRLSADPPLLRSGAGALRCGDHLLRSAGRRPHRRADPRQHQGRSSPSRRAARPSRCRTSRRLPKRLMPGARSSCSTTPGRRRSSSSRSPMASTCRSRRRRNISSAMPMPCSAPSPRPRRCSL